MVETNPAPYFHKFRLHRVVGFKNMMCFYQESRQVPTESQKIGAHLCDMYRRGRTFETLVYIVWI